MRRAGAVPRVIHPSHVHGWAGVFDAQFVLLPLAELLADCCSHQGSWQAEAFHRLLSFQVGRTNWFFALVATLLPMYGARIPNAFHGHVCEALRSFARYTLCGLCRSLVCYTCCRSHHGDRFSVRDPAAWTYLRCLRFPASHRQVCIEGALACTPIAMHCALACWDGLLMCQTASQ